MLHCDERDALVDNQSCISRSKFERQHHTVIAGKDEENIVRWCRCKSIEEGNATTEGGRESQRYGSPPAVRFEWLAQKAHSVVSL